MAIPSVNITILANGLGNVAPSPSGTIAVFGTSSGGTEEIPSGPYYRLDNLVTDYGYGPGVELCANLIQSGIPVIFTKVETDVAGAAGSVTHNGTGLSVMTVTGADPFDAYDVIVYVTKAGTAGSDPAPGIKISLDGGQTVSSQFLLPANRIFTGVQAQTGMTLTFTAATLVEGDTYTFSTTAPLWAAADVADAITSLRQTTKEAGLLYVVGACLKSQADTIATAVNAFAVAKRFVAAVLEARDFDGDSESAWMTSISNDYQTFQNNFISIAAGPALIPSAISGVQFRRNIGQLAIVRAGLVSIGTDLGEVEDGALTPNKLGQPTSVVYHNEALNPGLDAAKFMTVMSHNGLTGFYITNPNVMCAPDSDFTLLQYCRVINEAARQTNIFFTKKLSSKVRLNKKTGFILEKDARALESGNNTGLQAALVNPGEASDAYTTVSRVDNISTTKTLTVEVSVLPDGYIKTVNATLSFFNPALGAAV